MILGLLGAKRLIGRAKELKGDFSSPEHQRWTARNMRGMIYIVENRAQVKQDRILACFASC